jgi:hypothetical protein
VRRCSAAVAAAAVGATLALAGGAARAGEATRLDVALGKTVEVDVGYAAGWMCDDPTLVRAQVVTRHDRNVWILTGAKLGRTACRVGTDPYRPHRVFDVHVVEPPARRSPG